jgi:hypothetical protein
MKRRWFAVFGALVLAVAAVAAALLGRTVLETPVLAVGLVTWAIVGVLSVLGGLSESVAGIPWYRFVGASDALIGVWMTGYGVTTYVQGPDERVALVTAATMGVGGVTLALIGVAWFRGGRHFDLDAYEPGPILGG